MLLIKNGTIYTMEDGIVEGDILIKDGKIKKIEKSIECDEAQVFDASGKVITPGFIDAHTHLGLRKIGHKNVQGINEINEKSNPLTPHARAIDGCCPFDSTFEESIAAGVTSVCITPGSGNVIGGQSFFAKLHGETIDDMVVKNPVAMKAALGENPMKYGDKGKAPFSRMGVAMVFREFYYQAQSYFTSEGSNSSKFNIQFESMRPVIRNEIPMMIHAHSSSDILTAIRLAKEFGFKMTIEHCSDGERVLEQLRKANHICVVGPLMKFNDKPETGNRTLRLPGVLSNAGVKVCLTTDATVNPLYTLPIAAALAVKNGMDYMDALKAITINAAEARGVENRVGSLKVGKDADLVVWDGDPLNIASENLMTLIEGKMVFGTFL